MYFHCFVIILLGKGLSFESSLPLDWIEYRYQDGNLPNGSGVEVKNAKSLWLTYYISNMEGMGFNETLKIVKR